MNIDFKEYIRGKLAIITHDRGQSYDWGILTTFGDALALKHGDVVTIPESVNIIEMTTTLLFTNVPTRLSGYLFIRGLAIENGKTWEKLFGDNKYVIITRSIG